MNGNNQIDLVLVNPCSRSRAYQSLSSSLTAVEPPVWAGLMATLARRHGYSVAIVDADAEELEAEAAASRIADMKPRLVAAVVYGHQPSASTQTMAAAGALATAIKRTKPDLKVLLVGGHVAALPGRTLQEEDADFVAGGEGLYTILDLLAALTSTQHDDLSQVRDLVYHEDGIARANAPAPLLTDLDTQMPEVAWDLLPMARYRAHNWHCFGTSTRQPYAAIYTSLGCPYKCTFCCIQAPFKQGESVLGYRQATNSYRFWSPETVVAQIDMLVQEYGVRNIKFADEMFVLNRSHVANICDLLIDRGYDLNIWAYARVDTVREDMLDKLKRAGFNWLALGIESASERVRKDVQKNFDQEQVYRTVGQVQSAGINVIGNYIFGLPEDDESTMQETLDLALGLNCEMANFYCAMAYPGSELYETALEKGWPLPESWAGYSQHAVDTLPLPTKHLSSGEVLAFRDRAFQTYFTSPSYVDMVKHKFGEETAAHIREMTSYNLERKFAATR